MQNFFFFFPLPPQIKQLKLEMQDVMRNKRESEKKKKNTGYNQRGTGARPADRKFWQTKRKAWKMG